MVVGEEFLQMAVGFGGRAVGVELHGLEVAVECQADVALLTVGIATQVVGFGKRFAVGALAVDNLAHGIQGFLSLAAGQHILDFLYGFHHLNGFVTAKLHQLREKTLSLPLFYCLKMLECDCHIAALDRDAIVGLLTTAPAEDLYQRADRVRHDTVGDEVHLRGLIEFSNICRNDCLYCGIRRSNRRVQRYRMDDDELVETARRAAALGFQTIVLQSGEDLHFDQARMCRIIEQIKRLDVAITLSVGERDYADYKAFREAGADRYLLRIETTDRDLYHRLNPGMSWERRHECLLMIRELGYEVGSGIMVGQPGQTIASIADDLLYLKDLGIDMAGIGPFIPHPDTPLAGEQGGTLELALRTMAVMRLLMPDINIPATTAMESLHPQGRIMALQAGANVVMPNVTEGEYRRLYELYPGKICVNDTPAHCRSCIGLKIQSIGRTIGQGWGGHKTNRN